VFLFACLKKGAELKMMSGTGREEANGAKGKKGFGLLSRMELEHENEQLKQQVEQLNTLHEIGRLITSALELDRVLTQVVEAAVFITKAEEGALMLLDERTSELYIRAQKGLGEEYARGLRIKVEDSIAGEAVKTGEPRRLTSRDRVLKVVTGYIVNAILYVPMTIEDRVIGVLSVDNRTFDQPFTEDDEHLLSVLADYAAIAIENARLVEGLRERAQVLTSLHRTGRSMLSASLGEVLNQIAKSALEVLEADIVILYEYDKRKDDVIVPPIIQGAMRKPEVLRDRGSAVPHRQSVVFKMIRRGQPFYASNAEVDWAEADLIRPSEKTKGEVFIVREEIVSSAGIPLIAGDESVGIVFVNYRTSHPFADEEKEIIEIFANQAAIAIQNARLFRTVQRHAQELSTLYHLSLDIIRQLEVKPLLETIVQRAADLLGADGGGLLLRHPKREEIEMVVAYKLLTMLGMKFEFGQGLVGRVAQSGKPMIVNDYHAWEDRDQRFEKEPYKHLFRAVAGVPLRQEDEVIGVLAVSDTDEDRVFVDNDVKLLERFATQAAIAISNARTVSYLRRLVSSSPNAIIAIDRQGFLTTCNEGAERIMGYAREEVLGKFVADYYWDGLEEAKKINRMLISSEDGIVRDYETFLRGKEGEKIPVLFSGALLRNQSGDRIGSVGAFSDLRVKALRGRTRALFEIIERMNRSEELQEIFDTILDMVLLFKGDAGSILLLEGGFLVVKSSVGYVNERLEELRIELGSGIIGRATQQGESIVVPNVDLDDQYIRLSDDAKSQLVAPMVVEDKVIGALSVESNEEKHFSPEDNECIELINILASQAAVAINRAQLKQEKEQTQRRLIASANAVAAGQIAAGVAHEVKNSLNSIALAVGNIGEKIHKEEGIKSKKQFDDKIKSVESEILRLYDLVQRLHRFSQRLEPKKSEVYLNDIVRYTLELMDGAIRGRNLVYTMQLDSALDCPASGRGHPVFVDERQIQQVIINMTLNAMDASRSRGKLLFQTELREDAVEIRITDYGKGITPEEKRELFKPFFTTKPEGTGLGLYICKMIVEDNHEGRIEVSTRPGKGTTFSVFLPKRQKKGG
jgi:PAS domain S-box-containing protein